MTADTGMLAGLGLDEVPDRLPETEYAGFVFDLKVVNYKDTAKGKAIVMTYKVADGKFKGETQDHWQSANAHDGMQQKKFLKQMFTNIGVPESKINSVTKEDVVGTPVFFTIKHNGNFVNVTNVKLRSAENGQAVKDYETAHGIGEAVVTTPKTSQDIADLL